MSRIAKTVASRRSRWRASSSNSFADPAVRMSFGYAQRRASLLKEEDLVGARRTAAAGREMALTGMGYAAAGLVISGVLIFILANALVDILYFYLDPRIREV